MTVTRVKKKAPSDLPLAQLYLDDLQEIINVFEHALDAEAHSKGAPLSTTFTVGNQTCDAIADLATLGRRSTHKLEMVVGKTRFTVRFQTDWLGTSWSNWSLSDENAWNVSRQLQDIFASRTVWWKNWARKLVPLILLTGVAGIAVNRALVGFFPGFHYPLTVSVVTGAILMPVIFSAARTKVVFSQFSEHAEYRREIAWRVLPDAFKIVISFALGFLTEYLIHKYNLR